MDSILRKFTLLKDFDDPRDSKSSKSVGCDTQERQFSDSNNDGSENLNFMAFAALFELICELTERDPAKRKIMLSFIANTLAESEFIPASCFADCLKPARQKFLTAIKQLLNKAHDFSRSQIDSQNSIEVKTKVVVSSSDKENLKVSPTNSVIYIPSRYQSDYKELGTLGKGGFGQVYKVQSCIDDQCYAIKKIAFDVTSSSQGIRSLREVKILAGLNHPNIVRYFGAWLEMTSSLENSDNRSSQSSESQNSCLLKVNFPSRKSTTEPADSHLRRTFSSPSIVFDYSNQNNRNCTKIISNGHLSKEKSWSKVQSCENKPKLQRDLQLDFRNSNNKFPLSKTLLLYLQMELGSLTLGDWIWERNNRILPSNKNIFSHVDPKKNEFILKQIINALSYIHRNGIIHRDVKPSNIFIRQPECRVMLGDFGLACISNLPESDNKSIEYKKGKNVVNNKSKQPKEIVNFIRKEKHWGQNLSSGIGTVTYAAPEQMVGRRYDHKVDVYSLGMIAYEMYYPFRTNMERTHCLLELKKCRICPNFEAAWPAESFLIRKMVHSDASMRPSAQDLMEMDFFMPRNDIIENLKHQLTKLMNEMNTIKRQYIVENI